MGTQPYPVRTSGVLSTFYKLIIIVCGNPHFESAVREGVRSVHNRVSTRGIGGRENSTREVLLSRAAFRIAIEVLTVTEYYVFRLDRDLVTFSAVSILRDH